MCSSFTDAFGLNKFNYIFVAKKVKITSSMIQVNTFISIVLSMKHLCEYPWTAVYYWLMWAKIKLNLGGSMEEINLWNWHW